MSSPMLHVALFKFDREKLAAEYPGNSLQEDIKHFAETIPGVLELTLKECNTSPWPGYVDMTQGYTHCVASKHKDAAALKFFDEYPPHNVMRERLAKCRSEPPLRMEMNL